MLSDATRERVDRLVNEVQGVVERVAAPGQVQLYQLRKAGVPEVLFTPVVGSLSGPGPG